MDMILPYSRLFETNKFENIFLYKSNSMTVWLSEIMVLKDRWEGFKRHFSGFAGGH